MTSGIYQMNLGPHLGWFALLNSLYLQHEFYVIDKYFRYFCVVFFLGTSAAAIDDNKYLNQLFCFSLGSCCRKQGLTFKFIGMLRQICQYSAGFLALTFSCCFVFTVLFFFLNLIFLLLLKCPPPHVQGFHALPLSRSLVLAFILKTGAYFSLSGFFLEKKVKKKKVKKSKREDHVWDYLWFLLNLKLSFLFLTVK